MTPPQANPVVVPPMDDHNQALVSNVHPPDWVNPEPAPRYNLVVIGAGTAGLVTAAGAAGLGRGEAELTVGVRPAGGQSPQGAVLDRDLQVQGETPPQNGMVGEGRRRRVCR